jgi:dolichyl-phosphate-mannose-protein mannosyltransferase
MHLADKRASDPHLWCALFALAFLALTLVRLGVPAHPYFDETHYVPAAINLLALLPANREHPLFAKEIMAAAITALGKDAFAWRLPSALVGALGLYAFGRVVWHTSHRRAATIIAMVLLAGNFMWFIQSRIAMLDIFAASLALVGLWQFAAAPDSERPRLRLALAGLAMGLAMASKWSAIPLAMLPGLAFLALRISGKGGALQRISLVEAAGWLGAVPLAAYWLTFAPGFFYVDSADRIGPLDFIAHHKAMLALQQSVTQAHTYQSVWWQWLGNLRPIWYLYEVTDGAQRGVLLVGNPLTMLAGLPALLWCAWAALRRRRVDALAMATCYAASLALWLLPGKPVQFYYHYLMPGVFLAGALALALDELWRRGMAARIAAITATVASLALFAWFWPILSAAPLSGRMAFLQWMWLESWH